MVYSGSLGSTNANTNEYFNLEEYRIISGTYNNQADPVSGANSWNSSLSVNDNGSYPSHADGLVFVNGYLMSPKRLELLEIQETKMMVERFKHQQAIQTTAL